MFLSKPKGNMGTERRFSREFELEAVRLVKEGGDHQPLEFIPEKRKRMKREMGASRLTGPNDQAGGLRQEQRFLGKWFPLASREREHDY